MKHIKIIFLMAVVTIIITGCSTSPVCVTSSVTPMSGKTVAENLGKCSGSDTAFSFLGLFMFGRPDLDIAIREALDDKKGDPLINVRCYETTRYFLLFGTNTVIVEGDAVKFGAVEIPVKGKGR
jgi:hypothetical protein